MALIVLAYVLTRFVNLPPRFISLQLPGIYLEYSLDFAAVSSILVAILAAFGANWLLHDHPARRKATTIPHALLPALTAWGMGVPLSNLGETAAWWVVLFMGGVLLALVYTAEYIVVDAEDVRHQPAAAGLTALSFTLLLILLIGLRTNDLRLYQVLPALSTALILVSLRTLYLRLGGRWVWIWGVVISVIVGQLAIPLHYMPLSPVRFGLLLLGPAYALTSLAGSLEDKRPFRQALTEPLLMLAVVWLLAFLLG